jgi:hypothetical protein
MSRFLNAQGLRTKRNSCYLGPYSHGYIHNLCCLHPSYLLCSHQLHVEVNKRPELFSFSLVQYFCKSDLFFCHVENDFLLKRNQDWEDSFQNLYYMLRKNMLNIFYGTFLLCSFHYCVPLSINSFMCKKIAYPSYCTKNTIAVFDLCKYLRSSE